MRKNNLFALLLAGVTAVGTLAAGTTVQADQTTTVNLNIEEPNASTYTLTVPSKTALDASGKETELNGGLTVKGTNVKNNVIVTVTSANGFTLYTDDKTKYVYYNITNSDVDGFKKFVFTPDEVNANNGTNKPVKAEIESYDNMPAGEYSDVLTFTAETVEDSGDSSDEFQGWKEGDTIEAEFSEYGTTYTRKYVKNKTIEFREQLSGEPALNYAMLPTNNETDDPKEKNIVKISEGGVGIIKVDPYTKQVTLTANGKDRKVIVSSLKVNGEEWISGGEGDNEPEVQGCIRVTSDNKEKYLGTYNNGSEDHIFGGFSDEETASDNAKELANKLYSTAQSENLQGVLVIYKYNHAENTYTYYAQVSSSNGVEVSETYRDLGSWVNSYSYEVYVLD